MKFAIIILAAAALVASDAYAGGFEKNVLWGAKYVGVGGAAVSDVTGPDALFFNPAGLATGREGVEVSGNFSPTWGKFSGPIAQDNVVVDGNTTFSPVFGALASYNITPQWGFGIGAYVSAGTKAEFTDASFAGVGLSMTPNISSDVHATEFAIGTGYELLPGLKLGASWRVVLVGASFATVSAINSTNYLAVSLDDLTDTRWNGFRLGAQYAPEDKSWGLGVTWRSAVDFTGNGTSSGQVNGASVTTPTAITGGAVSAASSLPSQIAAGGNVEVMPKTLRLYGEYVWTQYHRNQTLDLTGNVVMPVFGTAPLSDINLGWRNQTNVRLGVACTAMENWTYRLGYVYTTQVVPGETAKPNLSSPGVGHTIAAGAGTHFLDGKMDADLALEYSFAKGDGIQTLPATTSAKLGEYSSHGFTPHLSVAYRF